MYTPDLNSSMESIKERIQRLKDSRAELETRIESMNEQIHELEMFMKVASDLVADGLIGELINPAPTTLKGSVVAVAQELLAEKRYQTREILDALTARGIVVPGETHSAQVLRVSQILGKSGKFVADRVNGWNLKRPRLHTSEEKASGVAAPKAFSFKQP